MPSFQNHPDEGLLLRYLDGELPARRTRQVRHHLEACWQCRTAAEEVQETIAACVRYRQTVLEPLLPAPPAPWNDLARGFARIDDAMARESWMARLGAALWSPPLRWSVSAAAVVLLAIGLYYQFHNTPSVEAATLLRRAAAAEQHHSLPPDRVRVRTRTRQFVLSDRAAAQPVAAMFQAARYDFDDPLSARAYAGWRDGLAAKQDEVRTVPDPREPGRECFQIRTTAPEGDLASASLVLSALDLLPVEGRFEFRNQEWVELTGFAEAPATEGGLPATTRLETPERRAEPSRPAATPSGGLAPVSEELRVLAALHEIGADLGDPVDVKISGNGVLVSGIGLSAARQHEIHRRLDPMAGVTVAFSDVPAAAPEAAPAGPAGVPATAEAPKTPALEARLEKQLGSRAEFDRFSSQILDWSEAAMARAYALRGLAQRFPAGAEAALDGDDRALLNGLARGHADALTTQVDDLVRTLAPVLVSLGGGNPAAQGRPATAAWQASAEDAFRAGRRVEMLLSALLGVTADSSASANVPADLLTALGEWRADLEQCRQQLR
jgi:anti-sigma factor RsiW